MSQTKAVEKIKIHILYSVIIFLKNRTVFLDNAEKCGRAGQATDDNITQGIHFACRITKATDTHLEYVILIAFPLQP